VFSAATQLLPFTMSAIPRVASATTDYVPASPELEGSGDTMLLTPTTQMREQKRLTTGHAMGVVDPVATQVDVRAPGKGEAQESDDDDVVPATQPNQAPAPLAAAQLPSLVCFSPRVFWYWWVATRDHL